MPPRGLVRGLAARNRTGLTNRPGLIRQMIGAQMGGRQGLGRMMGVMGRRPQVLGRMMGGRPQGLLGIMAAGRNLRGFNR